MPVSPNDMSAVINEAAESSLADLLGTSSDNAEETAHPVATEEPVPESSDEDTTESSDEASEPAEEVALPEGYVAVPTLADQLATEFSLYDTDGAIEVPALEIEYKANGKVRRDRLDQVVKMAQMGVYNHEREVAREKELEQKFLDVAQEVSSREEQLIRLLEDEDLYLAARDKYLQMNTPEAKAQQLAEENQRLRNERSQGEVQAQAQRFYQNEILPSLQTIAQALPEVSEDELAAYLTAAATPFVENGMVHPRHYNALREYILNELTPWAQATHKKRSEKIRSATAEVSKKAEAAQISAQKAKRQVSKVTKPAPRGVSGSAKSGKSASENIDDAVADALDNVLSGIN